MLGGDEIFKPILLTNNAALLANRPWGAGLAVCGGVMWCVCVVLWCLWCVVLYFVVCFVVYCVEQCCVCGVLCCVVV